jgi:hypothetical protein
MFPVEFDEMESVEPPLRWSRKTRGATQVAESRTPVMTCDVDLPPKLSASAKVEPQTKPTKKRLRVMKSPTPECPGVENEVIDGDNLC